MKKGRWITLCSILLMLLLPGCNSWSRPGSGMKVVDINELHETEENTVHVRLPYSLRMWNMDFDKVYLLTRGEKDDLHEVNVVTKIKSRSADIIYVKTMDTFLDDGPVDDRAVNTKQLYLNNGEVVTVFKGTLYELFRYSTSIAINYQDQTKKEDLVFDVIFEVDRDISMSRGVEFGFTRWGP